MVYTCIRIVIIYLLSLCPLFGQSNILDSLKRALHETTIPDSNTWYQAHTISQHFAQKNTDSALLYAQRSLTLAKERFPQFLSKSYNNVGLHYMNQGQYDKATDYFFKAMEEIKKGNCRKCGATTLGNIGLIFMHKKEYEKSEQYLLKSIREHEVLKDSVSLIRMYNNIGLMYTEADETPERAIANFKTAESIANALKTDFALGTIYSNLGRLSHYKKAYTEALNYYQKSIAIGEKTDNNQAQFLGTANSAWVYLELKQYQKALADFDKANKIAEKLKNDHYIAHVVGAKSDVYKAMGDFEKALKYAENYMTLNDSIIHRLNKKQVAELEAKYQKVEQETLIQQQEIQLAKQQSDFKNFLIIAISLFLVLFGFFQFFRNRQKLKQKESELALQAEHAEAEKLRELDQLKSTFFANVSHEFRTPLTLIKAPLHDLLSGKLKGSPQKYFRIMDRNADRLLNLINQLLDLSKLESGKTTLQAMEGDIAKFVRAIAFSFESIAMRKQIQFDVKVPTTPIMLYFDPDKLEKTLTNLLSNAFKFTPEEKTITVKTYEKDECFKIEIIDTGIGIPEKELPYIFDRFSQVDETSAMHIGTGIGLALTKELVKLHYGKISVRSEVDKGTTFTISLPKGSAHLKKEEIVPASDITTSFIQKQKTEPEASYTLPAIILPIEKPTVLVVEDNADVRMYIHDQLAEDYHVLKAENGKIGLAAAIEHIPDLIISDVMMPEMDGIELGKKLKTNEKTSHIPIIMLTAKAEREDKIEGLETGADDYLTKPFDAEELLVRIQNLIAQRKRLREKFRGEGTLGTKDIAVTSVDERFLKNVMQTIEENMDDEDFSVEDLAKAVAMSRSQLHRKIKALTDISPSVFIRTMRLQRGRQLLEQNAGNATEVAFMVGFNSSTYFAKCFKEQFGMSPGEVGSKIQ